MPNRITITEKAYGDLDDIFLYIAEELYSPIAAGNLIDKIFNSIKQLNDFPLIGSVPDNDILKIRGYRLLPVENFLILYIPDNNFVEIIRIVYGRRDWENILLDE